MGNNISVKKRSGEKELLDFEKINKVLLWATENIAGVSASDVAMNAHLQIFDGITTKQIHEILVRSASDLISEKTPNYQYVAGNLLNYLIRKDIFDASNNLPSLYDVIVNNVDLGVYDKLVLEKYTKEDIDELDKLIKHDRDYDFTYAGIQQLVDKYLLKDRKTNRLYETPQYAYMLIAMTVFADSTDRFRLVKEAYNQFSTHKISLPTPIMSGVRTPNRQWSSCTLIDVGDSLDSIFHSNSAVGYYTSKRAGIGLNMGRVRAMGDTIRGGEVVHTGVIPFLRMFQSTTKSCTQNGIRGGHSTTHFPYWHREIEDILVLKNNKGTDDNRVRHMDYSIQMNRLFYRRFMQGSDISLFSPNDAPDLYEAFFKSNDLFEELYEKYEKNKKIKKLTIKASDLFNQLVQERIGTGRIYIMNVDHVNEHSAFKDSVYMSNLCVAPETKILTNDGYKTISELENKDVTVWNGEEWSETKVIKTGTNQKLIKINFSNGQSLECTEYHKFYVIKDNEILEVRASELVLGNIIEPYWIGDTLFTNIEVTSIENNNRFDDTYCVNEPKRNKVIFNNILTGNCQEITLPTTPINNVNEGVDDNGEIALCVLGAVNLGVVKDLKDIELTMNILVRCLDFIIENQDYPVDVAKKMLYRRSLGIGVTNFAYWLAKNGVNYDSSDALALVDELMEHIQYYGLKASIELSKEFGMCEFFNKTKYSDGILPIDTYNKNVDSIVNREYSLDWEVLRNEIKTFGLRNSCITAVMPCESSSLITNSTNGIEPIRDFVTTKKSKQGLIRMVVPEIGKLKNKYQLAFDLKDNRGITNIQAVMTKWIDQAISGNHYYDITKFENNEIPMSMVVKDIMYSYKMGVKTLYYANTNDDKNDNFTQKNNEKKQLETVEEFVDGCVDGACTI